MARFERQPTLKAVARERAGGDLFGLLVLVLLLGIFVALTGCQDSFMKQTTADKTSAIASLASEVDAVGNVTATFDPTSGQTQVLQLNSGSLAGAAVAIPPGSLSIPVSVVVGEGESLASSSFSQQIGLTDNSIAASGPSVSFIPSQNVQATNPFTLAIPFNIPSSLNLNDANSSENLVVMFRSIKVENGTTSYSEGVIPREQITVSKDKVTFQTTNFGLFQVGVAQTKVRQKIEKPAAQPPALMAEVGNPLIGVWSRCEAADALPKPETVIMPDGFFASRSTTRLTLTEPILTETVYTKPISQPTVNFGRVAPSIDASAPRLKPISVMGDTSPLQGGHVQALEFWKEEVFVGGSFLSAGAKTDTTALVRFNPRSSSWEPIQVSHNNDMLPLTVATVGNFVSSLLATDEAIYVAGHFSNPFGMLNSRNIIKLTKNNDSFVSVSLGAPPDNCAWISDVRRRAQDGSLFVVCNRIITVAGNNRQNVESKIFKISFSGAISWTAVGTEYVLEFGQENGPRSAVESLDVSDNYLAAFIITSTGHKVVYASDDITMSDVGSIGSQFDPRTLRFIDNSKLLVGGSVVSADSRDGLIKIVDLAADGVPSNDFISDLKGTVMSMIVHNGPDSSTRLAVGTEKDLQVYSISSTDKLISVARHLPSPSDADKYVFGYKSSIVPDLTDATRNSYFVAGIMGEENGSSDSGPDCEHVKVSIAKNLIVLPTVAGLDPVRLRVNNTEFKSGVLGELVRKEAASVDLVDLPMEELKTAGDSNGGMVLLPNGCGFTRNGQNIGSSFWIEANSFTSDDRNVCRYDITAENHDMKIQCGSTIIIPSIMLDMANDGDQWFGRVSGQAYSKRESIRFNRTEIFHTKEYFKSNDCTGVLVSSKTESGAYALPDVDVSGTIPIDLKLYKASGKIVGSDWFNSSSRAERYIGSCGISDWQVGVERDLPADKTCFVPKKMSPRMQITGDELRICGESEADLVTRPVDCRGALVNFKRPPRK